MANRVMHRLHHTGPHDGKKWQCCGLPTKDVPGCAPAFDYESVKRANDAGQGLGSQAPPLGRSISTYQSQNKGRRRGKQDGAGDVPGGISETPDQPAAPKLLSADGAINTFELAPVHTRKESFSTQRSNSSGARVPASSSFSASPSPSLSG